MHLHVVDMDYAGPSFNAQKWHGLKLSTFSLRFKNLSIDHVIEVLQQEKTTKKTCC